MSSSKPAAPVLDQSSRTSGPVTLPAGPISKPELAQTLPPEPRQDPALMCTLFPSGLSDPDRAHTLHPESAREPALAHTIYPTYPSRPVASMGIMAPAPQAAADPAATLPPDPADAAPRPMGATLGPEPGADAAYAYAPGIGAVSLGAAARSEFPVASWERYEFLQLLGQGGMGAVYKARDKRLNRIVALKFIRGGDPNMIMRFMQEARAQARIDHPHVCKVYEVGEVQGQAYIAMQYIDGKSLDKASAGLSLTEKIVILRQVAEAMQESHRLGIIHRALIPRREARRVFRIRLRASENARLAGRMLDLMWVARGRRRASRRRAPGISDQLGAAAAQAERSRSAGTTLSSIRRNGRWQRARLAIWRGERFSRMFQIRTD